MSKKDRLKAQSEKQLRQKREFERQEKALHEEAKTTTSKSVKKMRKRAAGIENVATMILKLLMLASFGYSAFFYGGVTIVGIMMGEMVDVPKKIAGFMGAGLIVLAAALFFAFFKKYIVQFALTVAGLASFLHGGNFIINKAAQKIADNYVTDVRLKTLDKTYMLRYYPILIMVALSFALMVIAIVKKALKKRRLKEARDNAPVKSIVD